jgi:2-polyprenyl-6-methoxyphenol hydroxylase-like FAD-dependent oxidoreductase
METTDVLVVGAGPVGLLIAAELARRGVACHLIERQRTRSPQSRALALHARTLESFDLFDATLTHDVLAQAYISQGLLSLEI